MNLFPLLSHGLVAVSLGLAAGPSLADDDCSAPVQQWQSREAVRKMAAVALGSADGVCRPSVFVAVAPTN